MGKYFLSFITIFILNLNYISAKTVFSGAIAKDVTWMKKNSPYVINDDIIVEKNASLTIEPGVKIVFSASKEKPIKLIIKGKLTAKGNGNENIVFTALEHKSGSWQGIIFDHPYENSSILEYCRVEKSRCAIACFAASPKIQNNFISENELAILCEDHSSPSIISNIISNNGIAEIYTSAIHCVLWSSPVIQKNTIEKSYGHSVYCEAYSSPLISENKISNLLGANIVCDSFSNPKISNNDLTGDKTEFGFIFYNSSPQMIKNKIFNKRIYGITIINASPLIIDNTFSQNFTGILSINSSPLIAGNNISNNKIGLTIAENSKPKIISNSIFENSDDFKAIRTSFTLNPDDNFKFKPKEKNRDEEIISQFSLKTIKSGWIKNFSSENNIKSNIRTTLKNMPEENNSLILFRSFHKGSWKIGVLNNKTSVWTILTDNNFHNGGASWSPDGNSIVFTSNRAGNWDIFIMDSFGNNIKNITDTPLYIEEAPPVWSPDGKFICFERETPECQTVIMDLASNSIKKINLSKIEENYPGLYPLVFVWIP